eukprot:CAMPEP_0184701214 /NCGR_PEP_ID=MMETSP0313-20130426/18688_1 /TAXON_ID=2792 /ORGANISM="Porphyridium aerugineum, Strain SAG 1380-2" /LENGTH=66 /DNA_ID=CAMNT_0027161195 /DNA_START=148 /DNA_END=345 /DNA_ORIENTATION=+
MEGLEQQLMIAVNDGDYAKVLECIQKGADINAPHEHGESVLMRASRMGHHDIVVLLLDHGANLHAK